jgi:competence protein ComEC
MITAALAALVLDRENALVNALATAALFILIANPQALFDISFQLSFASVVSISYAVTLWADLKLNPKNSFQKAGYNAVLLIIISITTSLATGPLVVHYFNQFSLAGIFSNMIIVPSAGLVVVPMGLLSGILSLFLHYLPLPGFNQFIADRFITTVDFFSRLPFSEFHPASPGILWLLVYTVFIMSMFILLRTRLLFLFKPLEFSSRVPQKPLLYGILSGTLLLVLLVTNLLPRGKTELVVPDIGQGDCSLIQMKSGKNILIDGGGTYDERFDIGHRVLAPFLWNRNIHRLDLIVLSHPHPDHLNGLKYILKKFEVGEVWSHGYDRHLPGYEEFNGIIAERHIKHRLVSPDDAPYQLGEATLSILHPARSFRSPQKKAYAAENDRSLVIRMVLGQRSLLFTGDIGTGAEKSLLADGQEVKCDLLKIAHHGSKSSSSEPFVAAARPSAAIVMVGRENRYHHPSDDVLKRYGDIGATIYRTDRNGSIMMRIDDSEVRTTTWNELELRRIERLERLPDWKWERENWGRLWISKWEL